MSDTRESPSGYELPVAANTDAIENLSTVPGATWTEAFNYLYERKLEYLDLDDSPVALWNFNDTLVAVRGPTIAYSAAGDEFSFGDIWPGVRGLFVEDGCTGVIAQDPALVITGDMSAEAIMMLGQIPGNLVVFCHGAGGETEAANILYELVLPVPANNPQSMRFISESGLGVDATYTTAVTALQSSFPYLHNIISVGVKRTSNVIQFYVNGRPFGSPSGALVQPTGGASGGIVVGCRAGLSCVSNFAIASLAIYNRSRPDAEWLASYNRSLGVGLGFIE